MMNDKQKVILGLLTEECAEVIQAISKAGRFGLDNVHHGVSNTDHLQQEIGDVVAIVYVLTQRFPELLTDDVLVAAMKRKIEKLKRHVSFLEDFDPEGV